MRPRNRTDTEIRTPSLVRRCRRHREMEEAHAEASRQLATFMEERAQADLEILRQIVETNRADSGFGGLSEAERREYIMNVLMTKHVILANQNEESIAPRAETKVADMKGENFLLRSKVLSSSDHDDDAERTCAICLNEYADQDEISWSHNPKCNHFFHRECIAEWLMSHDECPCCRLNFLSFEENDETAGTAMYSARSPFPDRTSRLEFSERMRWFLDFANSHMDASNMSQQLQGLSTGEGPTLTRNDITGAIQSDPNEGNQSLETSDVEMGELTDTQLGRSTRTD